MLGPIVIRAAPLLRSSRRSGFHNFSAMTPSAIGTTEARPRRRYREGARPSRRSCQWGNESSSNSACLVITFLTDRNCAVRRVPVGWFVREVKSVFARARARDLLLEEFPGAAHLGRAARSRDIGLVTSTSDHRWPSRGGRLRDCPTTILLVAACFTVNVISLSGRRYDGRRGRGRPGARERVSRRERLSRSLSGRDRIRTLPFHREIIARTWSFR